MRKLEEICQDMPVTLSAEDLHETKRLVNARVSYENLIRPVTFVTDTYLCFHIESVAKQINLTFYYTC
jgi:hypothetical protein